MLGANDGLSRPRAWRSSCFGSRPSWCFLSSVDLLVNRRVWGPRWPDLFSGSTSGSLHHFYRRDPEVGQVHTPQRPEETGIWGSPGSLPGLIIRQEESMLSVVFKPGPVVSGALCFAAVHGPDRGRQAASNGEVDLPPNCDCRSAQNLVMTWRSRHLPNRAKLVVQRPVGTARVFKTVVRLRGRRGSAQLPPRPLGKYRYRLAAIRGERIVAKPARRRRRPRPRAACDPPGRNKLARTVGYMRHQR